MDISLLQMLKHRDNYNALIPNLPEGALHKNTMTMVKAFGTYFEKIKTASIDIEEFKVYFFNFYKPNETEQKNTYYNALLEKCKEEPHKSVSDCMFEKMLELGFATQVANLIDQYREGDELDLIDQIGLRHTHVLEKLTTTDEFHVTQTIEDILEADENDNGIQFSLQVLRNGIRPLQRGDFIITAGRPDSGKTSFVASQLLGFLEQLPQDRPIIWFNNEGEGSRILKRIYQSVLQSTTDDLLKLKREGTLTQRYKFCIGGSNRIRIIDCHSWNIYQVERAIKRYNPGLVIFDMIDNITFPTTSNDLRTDQKLESMYQWARVLGVKNDFPVIATSQVSAEADQQVDTSCWPAQHMLKDSKTGKQGAADTIIMIGRNWSDASLKDKRYISTPKNKLARADSYLRSVVTFDAQRAQYEG